MACVHEACKGGGALECVAQRVDALHGVRATAMPDATDIVVGEAAKAQCASRELKAADTKARTGAKSMQSSRGLRAT